MLQESIEKICKIYRTSIRTLWFDWLSIFNNSYLIKPANPTEVFKVKTFYDRILPTQEGRILPTQKLKSWYSIEKSRGRAMNFVGYIYIAIYLMKFWKLNLNISKYTFKYIFSGWALPFKSRRILKLVSLGKWNGFDCLKWAKTNQFRYISDIRIQI